MTSWVDGIYARSGFRWSLANDKVAETTELNTPQVIATCNKPDLCSRLDALKSRNLVTVMARKVAES